MHKKLFELLKNDLNRRISEPGGTELLKKTFRCISNVEATIKIIGSYAYSEFKEEKPVIIKKASYAGQTVSLDFGDTRLIFPCTGMIVTKQELGLCFFFPNSNEPGVNLVLLLADED